LNYEESLGSLRVLDDATAVEHDVIVGVAEPEVFAV
jgi:hypothetical protein